MATGKELKRLREASKMSAEFFSNLIGISASRLRKWEQNDSTPRLEDALKIEQYFGTKLENLHKLSEVPKTSKSKESKKAAFAGKTNSSEENSFCEKCEELQRVINAQTKTIDSLEKTINSLEELVALYRDKAPDRPRKKVS